MQYLISFFEGIVTFISPCILPMLPIYISYFAGGGEQGTKRTLINSAGFVLGFTVIFMAMGMAAGAAGGFFKEHQTAVNLITGAIVILFGLNYIGILKFNLFKGIKRQADTVNMSIVSAIVFGMIFSIGWTPCVGAFLGSALMLASQQGHVITGMMMLLAYSAGLGIPFIISAVLVDNMKSAFGWIKKNYKIINTVCGIFLIIIGILMAAGLMGKFLVLFS
ncbi:MAG: cytochrome c biogenesis protein CcdA [Anaerovoracaceae bacterium]|nr:cytochrome c biogenesis protein CcdA [Anaerovoracaceae bacterium]